MNVCCALVAVLLELSFDFRMKKYVVLAVKLFRPKEWDKTKVELLLVRIGLAVTNEEVAYSIELLLNSLVSQVIVAALVDVATLMLLIIGAVISGKLSVVKVLLVLEAVLPAPSLDFTM